jgi:LacI family transcriptional regulator
MHERRVKKHRATLADVAARAGVSVTTASYILNRRSQEMRISEPTVERVTAAAVDLKYRPNRNARNLRSSSTMTVGLISDHVASGAFASKMVSGVARAARAEDHLLVIGESEGDPETEALLVEEMLDRQVDGIIYATLTTSTVTLSPALRDQRVVLLNCQDVAAGLPAVLPDELEGGHTAATALLDAGHDEDVWLVGEEPAPHVIAARLRPAGIRAALEEAGTALAGVVACDWAVVPAYRAVSRLLDSGVQPKALICLNDRTAMGSYDALREHGLRVPEDVAVVSFDGSDLAGWLRPALTSVRIPFGELGARAFVRLMSGATGVELVPMPLVRGSSIRSVVNPEVNPRR